MVLGRCVLNVLVLHVTHLPDCSVYYGSKNQYTVAIFLASRFAAPVSDSKELKLHSSAIPVKTNACTEWGVKLWADWSRARAVEVDRVNPTTPLLQMPVPDFAYWLGKFVLEIRKQTGTEYPPKTLYAIVCCFKRYFERNEVYNYDVNPLSPLDPRFGNFRSILDAEMSAFMERVWEYLRNKQNQSHLMRKPFSGQKGSLVRTTSRYSRTLCISIIARCLLYKAMMSIVYLKCEQLTKKVDEKSRVYMQYTDYGNKGNRGGLKHIKVDPKVVRQYENTSDPEHCIVNIFVKYLLY